MVNKIKDDVMKRKRVLEYKKKDLLAPFPVTWVTTYGPGNDEPKKIIHQANEVLKSSPVWANEIKPIGLVNKRGRNLGDKIFKKRSWL